MGEIVRMAVFQSIRVSKPPAGHLPAQRLEPSRGVLVPAEQDVRDRVIDNTSKGELLEPVHPRLPRKLVVVVCVV